jgi:hypothetical protein
VSRGGQQRTGDESAPFLKGFLRSGESIFVISAVALGPEEEEEMPGGFGTRPFESQREAVAPTFA